MVVLLVFNGTVESVVNNIAYYYAAKTLCLRDYILIGECVGLEGGVLGQLGNNYLHVLGVGGSESSSCALLLQFVSF